MTLLIDADGCPLVDITVIAAITFTMQYSEEDKNVKR